MARRTSSTATDCVRARTSAIASLRRVLRNPLAIRSFRWLHPDLATPLATNSSHASRNYAARDGGRGLRDAATRVESRGPSSSI